MKFLILLYVTLLVTGCSFKQEPVYVTKVKLEYIPIPNSLLVDDIILPKPPMREAYIIAGPIDRGTMDNVLIINLYKAVGEYKLKLKAIRDFDKNITNNK